MTLDPGLFQSNNRPEPSEEEEVSEGERSIQSHKTQKQEYRGQEEFKNQVPGQRLYYESQASHSRKM